VAQRLVDHEPEILVAARERERERRVVEIAVEHRELAGGCIVLDRMQQRRALAEERIGAAIADLADRRREIGHRDDARTDLEPLARFLDPVLGGRAGDDGERALLQRRDLRRAAPERLPVIASLAAGEHVVQRVRRILAQHDAGAAVHDGDREADFGASRERFLGGTAQEIDAPFLDRGEAIVPFDADELRREARHVELFLKVGDDQLADRGPVAVGIAGVVAERKRTCLGVVTQRDLACRADALDRARAADRRGGGVLCESGRNEPERDDERGGRRER
jgi:hypothetical protein